MSANDEFTPAEERLRALPDPPETGVKELVEQNRKNKIFVVIASLAASIAFITLGVALDSRGDAKERSARNAQAAAAAQTTANQANVQASAAVDAAKEANRRLAAAGKPTVPVPTITVSASPIAPQGLSSEQTAAVQILIADSLSRYQPVIPQAQIQQIAAAAAALVPKPKDGHTPTAAELQPLAAAAQAQYCAGGKCLPSPGPSGPPGPSGAPGEQGKTGDKGADAPPVTNEQLQPIVAAGITAYCGQESKPCQGERGPAGTNGQNGYSVVDQDCLGNGEESYWQITLNNGTDQKVITAQGPCRIGPAPPTAVPLRTK